MTMAPEIVFCADDFTGASDTLATLARAGLSARLFLRVSDAEAALKTECLDAIGVATSLRSMSRADGRKTMAKVADGLASLGARFSHLKICSTFDSAPQIGNICETADVFAEAVGAQWIAILGGQPSLNRYCLFGNLFAAAGDGDIYRIDRHPTMKAHPITPMTEADLRKHLGAQGWERVGLVDFRHYAKGAADLTDLLERRIAGGETRTLFDVSCDNDLALIGDALIALGLQRPILCVGASSVAEALCALRGCTDDDPAPPMPGFTGPVFAFAGSRSVVTAAQVARATLYDKVTIAPDDFFLEGASLAGVVEICRAALAAGRHVLAQVSDQRQGGLSGRELAAATAQFIKDVVSAVRPGCLAIAGGDTSSVAVEHLGVDSISVIADFDRGVPLVRAYSHNASVDALPMILKGGQVGSADLFDRLAQLCEHDVATRKALSG